MLTFAKRFAEKNNAAKGKAEEIKEGIQPSETACRNITCNLTQIAQ